jgi:DNA polymerase IV
MDAFYASVEQRDHPHLRGKPVIVGGEGRRGVVSTCSYEARKYGVKSAMPSFMAKKLCPQATFVPVRMAHYAAVSKDVMAVFSTFSPTVEPLSLDEAFLDITGMEHIFGQPMELAWKLQRAVYDAVKLTCSIGVASNKYVAKVASDLKKPGGIVVVQPGEERSFLASLPIDRIWGVGPKTADRLRSDGFSTIGDIAAAAVSRLKKYGSMGEHIHALACGVDERPIDDDRERKSIGAERTLMHDIAGTEAIRRELLPLIDDVTADLRRHNLRCRGLRLKLKTSSFHGLSRERMFNDTQNLRIAVDELLAKLSLTEPVRLVGIAATHLVDADAPQQADLFSNLSVTTASAQTVVVSTEKQERLERAMDKVNQKFGDHALRRAVDED